MTYKFKYENMEFSKDGSFDEVLALDRYAVSEYDNFAKDDTVVFPSRRDEDYNSKQVGVVLSVEGDMVTVTDRKGREHIVESEVMSKALETKPKHLWSRWAKGASSVENKDKQKEVEDELRWLFDGYRFSPGGRIQLMLGQETVTGKKAPLTAFNCFVIPSPKAVTGDKEQFLEVLEKAFYEASIMRRGGGVGVNISHINTISGASVPDYTIVLNRGHKDSNEFKERIDKGKFNCVNTSVEYLDDMTISKYGYVIKAEDSVDGLFSNMNDLVEVAYSGKYNHIYIDFSSLRHRNAVVKGVNGHSSGAVSWAELFSLIVSLLKQDTIDNVDLAEIFSTITNLIEQGGSRRGALMLVNNSNNPNITKFIERKKIAGYLEGANISVGIDDNFMTHIEDSKNNPDKYAEEVAIWDNIVTSAWKSAEPGIIWLERYNKESNSSYYNTIEATNPCGGVRLK